MEDFELALKYAPRFYADNNEPFMIKRIGYTVIREPAASPSFQRKLNIPDGAELVIEYAVYFDFDIQHMYDLEHVWVYLDSQGKVFNAESSAHGSYWNCYQMYQRIEDDTHVVVYLQPGKHAMLPDGEIAKIFTNYIDCCNINSGGGLLEVEMFRGRMPEYPNMNDSIRKYIHDNFSFVPSMQFEPHPCKDNIFVPIRTLIDYIPERIREVLEKDIL